MRVDEFERAVVRIENITIRIRTSASTEVGDYEYKNRAEEEFSISRWLEVRVVPFVGNLEVAVIDGDNYENEPHRSTKIKYLRRSY